MSTPLTRDQIKAVITCLINAIAGLKKEGVDGVQFRAAHGGLLGNSFPRIQTGEKIRMGEQLKTELTLSKKSSRAFMSGLGIFQS